jgi:hypothetical protein
VAHATKEYINDQPPQWQRAHPDQQRRRPVVTVVFRSDIDKHGLPPFVLVAGELDLDERYPEGGYSLVELVNIGIRLPQGIFVYPRLGYRFETDRRTYKLQIFQIEYEPIPEPLPEPKTIRDRLKRNLYERVKPEAPARPRIEMPAGTDLSTWTGLQFVAFGRP